MVAVLLTRLLPENMKVPQRTDAERQAFATEKPGEQVRPYRTEPRWAFVHARTVGANLITQRAAHWAHRSPTRANKFAPTVTSRGERQGTLAL
jgi:hypothetical protein